MTPNLPELKGLLFDLDGTLVDSTLDLAASSNYLRRLNGLEPLPVPVVAGFIGNGVDVLAGRLLGSSDPDLIARGVEAFKKHYREHCLDSTRPYPGVEQGLKSLRARGFKMAVVTNKPTGVSRHMLERLGLAGCFGAILGGEDSVAKKPDPAALLLACGRLSLPSRDCAMVGDSEVDVAAGRNAGMFTVAIRHGIGDQARLAKAGPDLIADSFEDFMKLF